MVEVEGRVERLLLIRGRLVDDVVVAHVFRWSLAKHLKSVLPPSAPETPTRSERVVISAKRDKERGFCSQFGKMLHVTAFRPRASGMPGPLENAGVRVGDRLVRVGLERMTGRSLTEAMVVLAKTSAAVERVELEFVREVPL